MASQIKIRLPFFILVFIVKLQNWLFIFKVYNSPIRLNLCFWKEKEIEFVFELTVNHFQKVFFCEVQRNIRDNERFSVIIKNLVLFYF